MFMNPTHSLLLCFVWLLSRGERVVCLLGAEQETVEAPRTEQSTLNIWNFQQVVRELVVHLELTQETEPEMEFTAAWLADGTGLAKWPML